MRNRKGFTLIEIITVIIIISVLLAVITPSMLNNVTKNREKLYDVTISNLVEAAKNYAVDNPEIIATAKENGYAYVSTSDLCLNNTYIECPIVDPSDDSYIEGKVRISYSNDTYTYEFVDSSNVLAGADYVISKEQTNINKDKEELSSGLEKNMYDSDGNKVTSTDNASEIEYRYSGTNPNNYMTFNNETWRIVGIFQSGTEYELKIVRNTPISLSWDTTGNVWNNSSIKNYLTTTYYNSLSSDAKSQIDTTMSFNTNAISSLDINANQLYINELNNVEGYSKTWNNTNANVGTLSLVDFVYASNETCRKSKKLNEYTDSSCSNWLLNLTNNSKWTSNADNSSSNTAWSIDNTGLITSSNTSTSMDIFPVLYIKSNIELNGKGSSTNPYTVVDKNESNTFILTFNAQGGLISESRRTLAMGDAYGELPTPVKNQFNFIGWFTAQVGGEEVTSETIMGGANTTIYAHWAGEAYLVTLDANGGTILAAEDWEQVTETTVAKNVDYSSTYGSLPVPTRNGYTFAGWYTDTNYTTQVQNVTIMNKTNDSTLYAKWSANVIALDWNENNGNTAVNGSCTYDGNLTLASNLTRTGYTFNGWKLKDGSYQTPGAVITNGCTYEYIGTYKNTSTDIEALWCINCVTPTNGSCTLDASTPNVCNYTSSCNIGYDIHNQNTYNTTCTPKDYIIVFDPNGGTISTTSKTVTFDSPYGELPTPSWTGHTFIGWYTQKSGGSKITSNSTVSVTTTQTLYARWDVNSYTVTLNANNGTVTKIGNWTQTTPTAVTKDITYETTYGEMPTPVRNGYVFDGWYTDISGGVKVESSTQMLTASSHTLFAHWTANIITLDYNENNGAEMSNGSCTYDGNLVLPSGTTRSNYTFNGWKLDDNNYYSAGTTITKGCINSYIGTYSGTSTDITAAWCNNCETPTNGNCTLDASTPGVCTYQTTCNDGYTISNEGTYIPVCTPNTITIDYNENSGNAVTNGSCTYDANLTLATPTKDGYTFADWKLADNSYAKAGTTITNGCINTYLGTYSETSTAIVATWCLNCNSVSNGTCTLTASNGTCSYATTCNTGYTISNNGKYNPICTANSYVVTFDANEGSVDTTTKTVTFDNEYGTLPTPTYTGHTFKGWYTQLIGGTEIKNTTKVSITSPQTLYAIWDANKYAVTLNANNGTVTKIDDWIQNTDSTVTKDITYATTYGTLPTPVRNGYTFAGWYTAVSDGDKVTSSSKMVTADSHVLFAHWTANTITLDYNENDGVAISDGSCTYDKELKLPSATTRSDYTFNGWKLSDNNYYSAGTSITNGCTNTYTGAYSGTSTSIEAQWCNNCIKPSNGDCTLDADTPGTCKYTTTCNDGYTISGNGTYNPTCTANTITIDYQENGGNTITNTTCTYDGNLVLQSIPTRSGYTFAGWKLANGTYKEASSTVANGCTNTYTGTYKDTSTSITATWCENCSDVSNGSCTLTASNGTCSYATSCNNGYTLTSGDKTKDPVCTPNTITIDYNENEGNTLTNTTCTYNSDLVLSTPERSGYTFNGWKLADNTYVSGTVTNGCTYTKLSKYDGTSTAPTAEWCQNCAKVSNGSCDLDVSKLGTCTYTTSCNTGYTESNKGTYNPTCTAKTFTVTFNANGGTTSTTSKTVTYDETYGTLPTPTWEGHTFKGWYTKTSGGTKKEDTTTVKITDNETLYAIWDANKYTVTLNANGGTVTATEGWTQNESSTSTVTKDITYATTYGSMPDAVRNGYVFDGWYTAQSGGNKVESTTSMVTAGSHALYAHWTANTITLDWNENSGSTVTSGSCTYDQTLTLPAASTRSGYTFNGWKLANGTYKDASSTVASGCTNTYIGAYSGTSTSITAAWCNNCIDVSNGTCNLDAKTAGKCTYTTSCNTGYTQTNSGTYNPKCSANTIDVDYNENEGTALTNGSCTYDSTLTLATPTRSGYVFNGWKLYDGTLVKAGASVSCIQGNLGVSSGTSTSITAQWCQACSGMTNGTCNLDATTKLGTCTYTTTCNTGYTIENDGKYNATCNPNTLTINFNENNGTSVSDNTCTYNSTLTLAAAPTRSNYRFNGWKLANGTYAKAGSTVANGCTNTYTGVSSGTSTSITAAWCEECSGMTNGTCELNTDILGTCKYTTTCNDGYTIQNNGLYNATCKANTITIDYQENGGNALTNTTCTYNSDLTLSTPTRSGYTFAGWKLANNTYVTETVTSGCTSTYTGVTSGTSTSITASWCENCKTVANGTCKLTASNGSCSYATSCNTGYTETNKNTVNSKCTAKTFTLTANANGGTIPTTTGWTVASDSKTATKSVTYNQTYGTLPTPERSGYTFNGWFTASSGGTQKTSTTTVTITATETLYAQWGANSYAVTLNANGGTVTATDGWTKNTDTTVTKDITYATTYGDMPTPTREGYTFNGWYTDTAYTTQVTSTSSMVTAGSHTLYAKWTGNNYTLSYDGNNGTPSATSKTVTYGSAYGTLATATRNGYTLNNWLVNSSAITSSTIVSTASNHTAVASWGANTITLNWNENGGTALTNGSCTYDSTLTLPAATTKTDYTFNGWTVNGTTYAANTSITSGCTYTNTKAYTGTSTAITAKWCNNCNSSIANGSCSLNANTAGTCGYTTSCDTGYTISNDGTYNPTCNVNTITIDYQENGGDTLTNGSCTYNGDLTLATPTRSGYKFAGWKLADNTYATGTVSSGCNLTKTGVSKDTSTSITATWCQECAEVSNGTCTLTASNGTCSYNTTCNTGYTLSGDGTRTPTCTAKTFTVSFDANGGSVDTVSKTVTYNSTYGTLPTPTWEGHTFRGWFTASSGGTEKTSSTTVSITTTETLYAQWDANSYAVTLNANGGTLSSTTGWTSNTDGTLVKNITYATTYGTLPTPTRNGYTFNGWYTDLTYTTQVTSSSSMVTAGSHILYAKWTANSYTLTYDANGGTVSPTSKSVTYNSTYGDLPTPTYSGYNFLGWYTLSSGGTEVTSTTTVTNTSNHTIYAQWEVSTMTPSQLITSALNDSSSGLETMSSTEYRYTGATPKNYVTFNGETWRIIGIFDNQLKLIRDESIGAKVWNEDYDNTWIGSDIQTYLTETYYNSLTSTAQNMVNTSATFNTGGVAYSTTVTTSAAYTSEKTATNGEVDMKVGLMTLSDYGYAASSSCRNTYSLYFYNNTTCTSNNWMYKDDNYYWTMTRESSYSSYAWYVDSDGSAYYIDVSFERAVRPVVYLKSSIQITGGSGTSTEPYTLGIPPVSFSTHSWDTIINAVQSNNISAYSVGDTKCVALDGFTTTNDNGCSDGEFAVRIANTSTPSECSNSGYSETACGFVLEFADVITTHKMNDTNTNVGGWPATSMRTYINDTIYNALPEDLREGIIDTTVVSGYGSSDSANFTSTDKLYLLSTVEVWGTADYDTLTTSETRQLDYYYGKGVTLSNNKNYVVKNNSGLEYVWWLRAANSNHDGSFYNAYPDGSRDTDLANHSYGVAPAFRIG